MCRHLHIFHIGNISTEDNCECAFRKSWNGDGHPSLNEAIIWLSDRCPGKMRIVTGDWRTVDGAYFMRRNMRTRASPDLNSWRQSKGPSNKLTLQSCFGKKQKRYWAAEPGTKKVATFCWTPLPLVRMLCLFLLSCRHSIPRTIARPTWLVWCISMCAPDHWQGSKIDTFLDSWSWTFIFSGFFFLFPNLEKPTDRMD